MCVLARFYSWNSNLHNLEAWTVSYINFPFSLRITGLAFIRCQYEYHDCLCCYSLSLYWIAYSTCPLHFRSVYCAFCADYFLSTANLVTILRSCSSIPDIFIYFCYESMLLGFLSVYLRFFDYSTLIFFVNSTKRNSYFLFINITIIDFKYFRFYHM